MEAMSRIADLQIGVIGLSEINANMHIDPNQAGLRRGIQSQWKNMKMIKGSCKGESTESHLQGGALLTISEGSKIAYVTVSLTHNTWVIFPTWKWKGKETPSY
jgi:hypothetical protein